MTHPTPTELAYSGTPRLGDSAPGERRLCAALLAAAIHDEDWGWLFDSGVASDGTTTLGSCRWACEALGITLAGLQRWVFARGAGAALGRYMRTGRVAELSGRQPHA